MNGAATGVIFDLKELSVHDGPGPRTTVFLKGCPLRCRWCHNPEGLRFEPELLARGNGCTHCGRCRRPCGHPECAPFGRCLHACPRGLLSVAGERVDADALAARLLRGRDFWLDAGGGVTVSGGEPLAQPEFLFALLDRLTGVHRCVETSGFAPPAVFDAVLDRTELLILDLKLLDPAAHRQWTGADNTPVLRNLGRLCSLAHPFWIRMPMIPGVTDSAENRTAAAQRLIGAAALERIELLPQNPLAAVKYPMVGRAAPPVFEGGVPQSEWLAPFFLCGLPARIA